MPNLGKPQEYTDVFGNVTVSPHAPTTTTFDSSGEAVPQRDVDTAGVNSQGQTPGTNQYASATNPAGNTTTGGTVGTPTEGLINNQPSSGTSSGLNSIFGNNFDLMKLAEEAKQQAIASGLSLEQADAQRTQYLNNAYNQSQDTMRPFMELGGSLGQAQQMLNNGALNPQGMNQYSQLAGQAPRDYSGQMQNAMGVTNPYAQQMQGMIGTPQSQYFDQAANTMNRPQRLEDIEGYGLMQQARDEALKASGQGFAGAGKFFSGSRGAEAANIGGQAAQNLIAQDNAQRQQNYSNFMGLGQQDVAMQQAGLGNTMSAYGLANQGQQQNVSNIMGLQQMTGQVDQNQLNNMRNLTMDQNSLGQQQFGNLMNVGGIGYNAAGNMANMQTNYGQQMGQNAYGTQQDIANLKAGGLAQQGSLAGLQLQEQMAADQNKSNNLGGLLQFGAMLGGAYFCDARLKENAVLVGNHKGVNIYEFNYIGDSKVRRGPMAQEVLKTNPDAVFDVDGYLAIDMRKL